MRHTESNPDNQEELVSNMALLDIVKIRQQKIHNTFLAILDIIKFYKELVPDSSNLIECEEAIQDCLDWWRATTDELINIPENEIDDRFCWSLMNACDDASTFLERLSTTVEICVHPKITYKEKEKGLRDFEKFTKGRTFFPKVDFASKPILVGLATMAVAATILIGVAVCLSGGVAGLVAAVAFNPLPFISLLVNSLCPAALASSRVYLKQRTSWDFTLARIFRQDKTSIANELKHTFLGSQSREYGQSKSDRESTEAMPLFASPAAS